MVSWTNVQNMTLYHKKRKVINIDDVNIIIDKNLVGGDCLDKNKHVTATEIIGRI